MHHIPLHSLQELLEDPQRPLEHAGGHQRTLDGGAVLWHAGAPADSIAWVLSGALRVIDSRGDLGYISPLGSIGEASVLIPGALRVATVQALAPTEVLEMPRARLLELRVTASPIYDAILDAGLREVVTRIERYSSEIASRTDIDGAGIPSTADTEPVDSEVVQCPPPLDALASLCRGPLGLPTAVLTALAQIAQPLYLAPGQQLCQEGAPSRSMFLLASGQLRTCRGGNAMMQDVVEPGALLGTTALIIDGCHTTSLVAHVPTWLYALHREDIETLSPAATRALREVLLFVTRDQLRRAGQFARRARGARGTSHLEEAMRGLSALRTWRYDTPLEISPEALPQVKGAPPLTPQKADLLSLIRRSIIGSDLALHTPFGLRRMVYADYTASGRCLSFIEDFLRERVMPLYANTHTEASASGLQTTSFREEARATVARSVGADERDVVIFTGSGATGAINKLLDILALRLSPDLDARHNLSTAIPEQARPVVFVGPYEHHSNILPWRHSLADLHILPLDTEGGIDLAVLEQLLVRYADRPLRIGSFSAASNVTGIRTDTQSINTLLHRHGALAFWDYAGAGPYVGIRMNAQAPDSPLNYKDAIFLSPHKFIGGPGTPGVLVVKRALVQNSVPTQPGGGTVDFVTFHDTRYSDSVEAREEAGTPAILESIRCGLVFQLKDQVGAETIEDREVHFTRQAITAWRANPALQIVGNPDADRLSITSFMVRYRDRYLHYNFVITLLNDLFGLQGRGGCSCAGPYGIRLLGLSTCSSEMFATLTDRGWLSLKPGWARVNFNYFISDLEFRYIVEAVQLVAALGWVLMPHYEVDLHHGIWRYRGETPFTPSRLSDLSLTGGEARWSRSHPALTEDILEQQLVDARRILEQALREPPPSLEHPDIPDEVEEARWFSLPHEAAARLRALQDSTR